MELLFSKEGRKYYKHANKAKFQSGYLSIIIDAMDQDKTSLPHLIETPKTLSSGWRLKMNLMAAIVHGIGIYGYFDSFQWSHGSSYTNSVLVHILTIMTVIPDVLYLQLDNCPGQNKNRYMLGFLALLVEAGIFRNVKLSFLMVGHTHEEIDQVFSRFSVWLNRNNALTMGDLIRGFEACYTPNPTGIQIHEVYNFSSYLKINDIANHSKPHVYKIVRETEKAVIYYKHWSTDKEWLLCVGDHLIKEFSYEEPIPLIPPSTKELDEKVEHDIKAIARFYRNDSMEEWWDNYFDNLKEQEDNWDEKGITLLSQLKSQKEIEPPVQEEQENISQLLEDLKLPRYDEPIPPVIIRKRQKKKTNAAINEEPQVGDMVLIDLAKYGDKWPQVAQIKSSEDEKFQIQWFKGSRGTSWTPATRRVKGCKGGKIEPVTENVHRCVIWHHGFKLTQSGLLAKAERDAVDHYFD